MSEGTVRVVYGKCLGFGYDYDYDTSSVRLGYILFYVAYVFVLLCVAFGLQFKIQVVSSYTRYYHQLPDRS